jgi:uncharacterized FlaG/YvyC family protein
MKALMSTPLLLPPSATAHQDDAAIGIRALMPQVRTTPAPRQTVEATSDSSEPPLAYPVTASSVSLSFAYDTVTKALNVVMTDKQSGEVVRKISYTHLPSGVHRSEKLQGFLLDQFA